DRERSNRRFEVGDGAERHLLSGRRLHVDRGQIEGAFAIARFDFQDDTVLIELSENGRNLSLAEGVVKRVVDCLQGDAEQRRFIAINDEGDLTPAGLLIGGDIAQLWASLQLLYQPRRPARKLRRIGILQSVPVLRRAYARVELDLLRRLQQQGYAWH